MRPTKARAGSILFLGTPLALALALGACPRYAPLDIESAGVGSSSSSSTSSTSSSSTSSGVGGAGGAGMDGGGGAPPLGSRPPPPPAKTTNPFTGKQIAFATRGYFFGRTNPLDGGTELLAWRSMGFDIDGVTTTQPLAISDTPGTCTRKPGMEPNNLLEDGDEGRDNVFGEFITKQMDFFTGGSTVEKQIDNTIAKGQGNTNIIVLSDLDDGPDDLSVSALVYLSATSNIPPVWDGTFKYHATLVADADYFLTLDAAAQEVWVTLRGAVGGAHTIELQ